MSITSTDRNWIEQQALTAGFDLASLSAVPNDAAETESGRRFTEWIAAGRGGDMQWLKRRDDGGDLVRTDVRRSMPWARSVIVVRDELQRGRAAFD